MSQSFGARSGIIESGLINNVNGAVVVELKGADGAAFWLSDAVSLAGLTLVPELRYGNIWKAGVMFTSNQTSNTPITVSATLTSAPNYSFAVPSQGADAIRLRASAITGGSVTLRGRACDIYSIR
jgi:hypothetical protein